jgi:hypothetical protein
MRKRDLVFRCRNHANAIVCGKFATIHLTIQLHHLYLQLNLHVQLYLSHGCVDVQHNIVCFTALYLDHLKSIPLDCIVNWKDGNFALQQNLICQSNFSSIDQTQAIY